MNKSILKVIRSASFFLLILLTLFCSESKAQQQDTLILTLEDAIVLARDNSLNAKVAKYSYMSTQWRYKLYLADFRPRLEYSSSGTSYLRQFSEVALGDGTFAYPLQQQLRQSNTLSLSQIIPYTGGTISVESALDRIFYTTGEEQPINEWDKRWESTLVSVGITQPIFAFNDYKWDLKLEPLRKKLGRKKFIQDMEAVATQASNAYFNLYLAQRQLEIAKLNMAVNDSTYQISKGRFNIGTIAENELLQQELGWMKSQTDLTSAEIRLQRARNNFNIYIGLEEGTNVVLVEPRDAPTLELDVQKAMVLAQENNSRFDNFKLQKLQAKRELDRAKKSNTFNASISARFGLTNQTTGDLDELRKNPENQSFVSLGVRIPILNWGRNKLGVLQQKANLESTVNSIELEQRLLYADINQQILQFNQLKENLRIAKRSDEVARKRYEVAKNRYLIGKVTTTDLQIAQREKDDATNQYVQALQTFWDAWYQIRQLTLYDFEHNKPINYEVDLDL